MAKPLTVAAVEKMKPAAPRGDPPVVPRREVPDALVPGLYLIVQPSGRKSWALRYRRQGKPAKHTLGSYPGVELTDAREQARELLRDIAKGKTPEQAKADRKAAEPLTFAALAARYIDDHAKPKKRSWAEDEATIARDLLPAWGQRSAAGITKRDVLDAIKAKAKVAPIRANRLLALVRKLFGWAVENDHLPVSPVAGIKPPSKESSRDRVLSDAELHAFWRGAGELPWPWGPYFKVLALTAQRRTEVATMRWADLDLETGLWTLPKESTKAERVHDVPLSPEVIDILKAAPRFAAGEYVFSTTGGRRPISGFNKPTAQLVAEMGTAQQWGLHDLRRSAVTVMARMGFPPHVASAVLNHSPRSAGSGTNAVTAVYQRYRYDKERRAALEAWARHLTQQPADNVVRFHATA